MFHDSELKRLQGRVRELEGMLAAKNDEIQRLVSQNSELHEKFMALLDPNSLLIFKRANQKPGERKPKLPMKVDEETGALREMTDKEAGQVMQGFRELGIFQ